MSDPQTAETRGTIHRVDGHLHRRIPIIDASGQIIQHVLRPLMVEIRLRDVVQILVGSALLAIPVAFTEEAWRLGQTLPVVNVVAVSVISLVFIAVFVHLHSYRGYIGEYLFEYLKRVIATYVISLIVAATILTMIQKCPWTIDWVLSVKRVIIVAFPASLSATLADTLK